MYEHYRWPSGLSWISKSGQTDAILKKARNLVILVKIEDRQFLQNFLPKMAQVEPDG